MLPHSFIAKTRPVYTLFRKKQSVSATEVSALGSADRSDIVYRAKQLAAPSRSRGWGAYCIVRMCTDKYGEVRFWRLCRKRTVPQAASRRRSRHTAYCYKLHTCCVCELWFAPVSKKLNFHYSVPIELRVFIAVFAFEFACRVRVIACRFCPQP